MKPYIDPETDCIVPWDGRIEIDDLLGAYRRGASIKAEKLLDEMRDALAVAYQLEQDGAHQSAHAWGQLAAAKLEQALACDYAPAKGAANE